MESDDFTKTIPLSETTKFIVDNRGRTAPTATTGIALIATNCISNERLYPAYENLRFVSRETYDSWFRSHPKPGDIILTNKGSQNGAICLVPDPVDFVIAQDMVALRANEDVIDPLFLFAALRSPDVQRQIKNLDVSGVIPHFKKTDFDKLDLPYPDRTVQELIGRIYFNFCAKIELNRRMNATLEAMARALFQSWFVDFDPVRAKLDGRRPAGLDKATAALFPSRFQDSPPRPNSAGVACGFNLRNF
ncbi:MAG: restriction endonuclease subunit S [Chthoniobacteraceae bacterium]